MEIIGGRQYVEIPGETTHELPPLLVRSAPRKKLDKMVDMAAEIVDSEEVLDPVAFEAPGLELEHDRRKMDLALNLVDQYQGFVAHWQWGDSVLEWIRQCEMRFDLRLDLRRLLRSDVWPHAGRASFVQLLNDKKVDAEGVALERAVGTRLTFRQPPPLRCFSNQFLFYLNGSVAETAYQTWASMSPAPVSCLPPERFTFHVVAM